MAQPVNNAPIAQRIERLTPIQKVAGSIPVGRAKEIFMHNCTIQYHSYILDKDININIYGSNGQPILAFPTQNSKADNYENFGLIEQIKDYINDEKIQFFVVDSIDEETWPSDGDKQLKSNRQEQYVNYSPLKKMGASCFIDRCL